MEVDFGEGRMEGKWRMREGGRYGEHNLERNCPNCQYEDHLLRECVQHRLKTGLPMSGPSVPCLRGS
jgi:hypothetical protein